MDDYSPGEFHMSQVARRMEAADRTRYAELASEIHGNRKAWAEQFQSLMEIIDEQGNKIEALEKRLNQASTKFAALKKQVNDK